MTFCEENLLYVQDNGTGLRVQLNQPESIELGDRVEVSGFIDTSRYLAGLRGASVRRLGRRDVPVAIPMTMTQIMADHQPQPLRLQRNKL